MVHDHNSVDPLVDSGLLEHDIRHIARSDLGIHGKLVTIDRAIPDFVVAFPRPVRMYNRDA
jgi:hypothetical protein